MLVLLTVGAPHEVGSEEFSSVARKPGGDGHDNPQNDVTGAVSGCPHVSIRWSKMVSICLLSLVLHVILRISLRGQVEENRPGGQILGVRIRGFKLVE